MDPKYPPDENHDPEGEYPADADEEQENKRIACLRCKSLTKS